MSVNSTAEVCRLLYSEKIIERKKAADRFKSLLNDKQVVAAIDRCSDEKSNFNWNSALQSVINHIQKELELKAKEKNKTTGTSSARARNVMSCSSLLKLVIRKASLIKARLQCQHIIDHILSVLRDDDARVLLGTEYSSILLNEVLEKRHVWSTVPHNMWQDLLDTFYELYSQPAQNLDRSLVMKTLERIISVGSVQTQLDLDALFPFFTEVAKKLRQEVTSHQENCVSALTVFSRAVALQCRIKLCQHGEDILHYILNLWEFRASSQKKEILIEYMGIQMVAHHPNGALTPENGAFVCDQRSWKTTLQKMYNCLQQELKEMLSKSRYAQSKQHQSFNLPPSFLRLLVEVCRQVNDYAFDDLNPIVAVGSIQKKRKTQTAFSTLLDTIHEHAESPNVVCWLQLLAAWLNDFPDTLGTMELQDLVLQLHQMIINCKKSEIVDALLTTCLACIGCYEFIIKNRKLVNLSASFKSSHWSLIYNEVQSTLNLSVSRESRLRLITTLVKLELVKPGMELWQLFGDNSRKCSDSFLALLAACLEQSPLPDHCLSNAPSVEQRSSSTAKVRHDEFRFQLLDWLLPCLMDEERQLLTSDTIFVTHLADILCSLVFRNVSQQIVRRKCCTAAIKYCARTSNIIADFYLRSSFLAPSMNFEESGTSNTSAYNKANMQDNTVLPDVMKKLAELLIRDVCHLLELSDSDTGFMKLLANHCCLLVKVMQQLISRRALSLEEVAKHGLTHHIHALFKKLVNCLEKCRKSVDYSTIFLQVVDVLSPLVVNDDALEAAFMRSVTPQKLIDIFMEVLHHVVTSSKSRLSAPVESDDDVFDSSAEFPVQDDFEDSSQNPSYFAQRIRNSEDLLKPDKLNNVELLAVKIGEFLSLWSFLDSHPLPRHLNSDTDTTVLKLHLLTLIKDTGFDFQTPLNLQLTLKVVKNLLSKEQYHNEDTTYSSVVIVKTLFVTFHKDVGITAVCLDVLKTLVFHAGNSSPKNQEATVHQLKAFWKLHTKKKLGVKLLIGFIQCVAEIAKVDKVNAWGRWEFPCNGGSFADSNLDAPVVLSLIQFLKHSSHEVQMAAAANLPLLVGFAEVEQLLPEGVVQWKNKVMQLAFKACREAEPETVCPNTDPAINYTAFLLKVVAGMAYACPYCENAAISFLFEVSSKKNVDLNIVNKVLDQIVCGLGYLSREEFVITHLKSILNFWLEQKWSLQSFPYQLLNCCTLDEFFRRHMSIIVVMVLLHSGKTGVDEVAATLEEDSLSIMTRCIPQIVAELLPVVVASKQNPQTYSFKPASTISTKALSSFIAVEASLTKEVLQNLMAANLSSVVVYLMQMIQEDEGKENSVRSVMPPTIPYAYPAAVIMSVFEELVQRTNCGKNVSIVAVLASIQDGLQLVLLELKLLLFRARDFYKKWRSLLIFASFLRQLLTEMNTSLAGNRIFIIQDIIYTLVHFLKANSCGTSVRCAEQVCLLLQEICIALVENCPDELGKHLRVIVGTLVSLELPRLQSRAAEVLKTLLVSNEQSLSAYIRCLDPLPDMLKLTEMFEVYQKVKYGNGTFSLKKEIRYFLKATDNNGITFPRIDGLKYLKEQLATRKEELKTMFETLQESEDYSDPLLHHLVVELLRLSSSPYEEEALEAGRCLGEIGPADLSNLVLKVGHLTKHKQILDAFDDDRMAQRNVVIFKLLLEYLFSNELEWGMSAASYLLPARGTVDRVTLCLLPSPVRRKKSSVELITTTSCVLKEILSTHTGQQFLLLYKSKDLDNLVCVLHPFTSKVTWSGFEPDGNAGAASAGDGDSNTLHIVRQSKLRRPQGLSPAQDIAILCDSNLWIPEMKDHQSWLTDLVGVLLTQTTDEVLVQLVDVAKMKYEFCEQILPFIIHSLLSSGNQNMQSLLSQNVSSFFEQHCTTQDASVSSRSSSQTSGIAADAPVYSNHQSIKSMLSVIQYLRTQNRNSQRCQIPAWENNFWLTVNYFHVARAAIYCRAYFTSLMALEMWFDDVTRMGPSHSQSVESVLYNSDDIYTSTYHTMPALREKPECETVYSLIMESYRSIGEPDGGYGCGAAPLTNPSIRVMQYEQENQWQKALSTYDSEALNMPSSMRQGLPNALKMLGLSHLLQRYLHHSTDTVKQENSEEFRELEYECAWRLGQWSSIKQGGAGLHFHQSLYNSLASIQERDFPSCVKCLKEGRRSVTQELTSESLESSYSIYPFLTRMQMLTVIEDYSDVNASHDSSFEDLVTKWRAQDLVSQVNFLFTEPIISLQCALLQQIPTSLPQMRSLVERLDLKIEFARKAGYLQIAAATVNRIKLLKHLDEPQSWRCQLQEARTFWQQEESQVAMHLIRNLLSKLEMVFEESPAAATVYSNALGVYSNWLIEARSESPNVILSYLDTAIKVCSDLNNSADLMDACLAAGRFADSHYQRIQNYRKSEMFEAKQELIQKSRKEAQMLRQQGLVVTQEQKKAVVWLEKQSKMDEKELLAMEEDQERFLEQALVNYLACLKAGDACNLRVFRLTSLWFQNQCVEKVNTVLQKALSIKTHKFLPVMYQSAARMGTDETPFQNTLAKLIEQVATDHPHHTLHIILALCNATADDKLLNQTQLSSRRSKTPDVPHVEDEERIAAAKNIWSRLRTKPHLTELMEKMEKLCSAYISLSNADNPKKTAVNAPIPIGNKEPLMKLPNLSIVPDVTMNIPVDPSANYSSVPGIARIEPYYKLCGGITAPKRLVCIGTDGVKRTQLLKGRDDLRQDAVMQQVFGIVNSMLNQNAETKKRNLNIRTYKVVPLSQRSGILQWCLGTLPVGDYLLGDQHKLGVTTGAHARYYPKDWTGSKCRKQLSDIASNTPEKKLQVFHEICLNLHPVFRHFFMENFSEPTVWFESRLMYTKSVATTSMVGYILGLGDRHVQNILIDQKTAELIHIDLGVAFEQGKVLPTPETIPFRLTRDIVDGMGITGVEGVFRRCCEKTLDVLRQSREVVTTILDVLLYDPLYVWSISPMKACTLQPEPIETQMPSTIRSTSDRDMRPLSVASVETQRSTKDGELNKHAERCLLRVQHKLQGMEEGVTISVMGQVNHLIQEATDPKNLCRLYSGWQAYL